MFRAPSPVYSVPAHKHVGEQHCDEFQRFAKNVAAAQLVAPDRPPPPAQRNGGPPDQPIGFLAYRGLRRCRCVYRHPAASRGARWLFKNLPARRCIFQPRSEYNEHAQRSTQRFDGSRRRSVPGRKRVRGIDPSATPRFSPSDPRNIHCARARCRPPRTDHRGSRLPRNKDE
jgi:hypothetical protein